MRRSGYSPADAAADGEVIEEEAPFSLWGGIGEALASIPANLGDALGSWGDPLGLDIGYVSSS